MKRSSPSSSLAGSAAPTPSASPERETGISASCRRFIDKREKQQLKARLFVKNNFSIRPLKTGEINSLVELAIDEGWILEASEIETHRRLRRALAVMLTDGQTVIGCVTAFAHHRAVWIGNLIVRSEWRGQGFGSRLIKHTLNWTESRFMETTLLAADSRAVPLYRRLGFKPLAPIYRWRREKTTQLRLKQQLGDKYSLRRIVSLDAACWNDNRAKLFDLISSGRTCLMAPENNGFLMSGRVGDYLVIGPGAVAWPDRVLVEHLFDRSLSKIGGNRPVVLDAFPANRALSKILDARGFSVVSSTLLMYRGRQPAIKFHNVLATATLGSMG